MNTKPNGMCLKNVRKLNVDREINVIVEYSLMKIEPITNN